MFVLRGLGARIAAYIALFAILMLTAAPTISQHLQSRAHSPKPMSVVSGHGHGHDHHAHHASPIPPRQSADNPMHPRYQPHHMMLGGVMGDLLACGYCELLIHVPFILWAFFPALLRLLAIRRLHVVSWQPKGYCPAPITFYPARGPPTGLIVR